MPEYIDTRYQTYTPAGLVDSIDGGTAKPGGMISLANLMPDQETAGLFICRPAAYTALNFTARLLVSLSFVFIVLAFPATQAMAISIVWGLVLLTFMSYLITRKRCQNPVLEILRHLVVAIVVIVLSRYAGRLVADHI